MLRRIWFAVVLLLFVLIGNAQLKSPEEFLGYGIGTRYTPHFKLVSYFNHVAANSNIRLQQYGETNEGRPLLVAFISSPENMKNLEAIRINNLRLANLAKDKAAPVEENAPAIVWLSYNVHGNEPSSSEASMLTLWSLVDPSNTKTKEWLKNTVVVIDPCINPDGRDRYVNWFNGVVGKNANPQLMAREHDEPWPGGRTNHYNFDLNRDWAWQTQVETEQRIKLYNQWLPQIHVDYHEQGIDEPYYFAPAAPSYHDVITPWQRNFQVTIGKNHAKYFDSNSWMYFTKEVFDLFYPSYGDTYPMFNGAIGMTYEQAGGPAGGLQALKTEGDTLTLADRALHHHTTGLSTIEIASQNAAKLVKEFRKYFNDATANGVGEYKTYIIKKGNQDAQRLKTLLALLDRNGISYSAAGPGSSRGYHYNTGKEEAVSITAEDVLISSVQPKGALVKALMEPNSHLEDSITYDITAWSLPYVFGLDAYAIKENLRSSGAASKSENTVPAKTDYGYV
ncbi:MAG: M14 metallopeptidase family protein, partial [Bacteroidota bacterium]